ncbi:DUF2207 family protein [Mycolicibacterium frederiksbergense]|uniref:DUF2207 domain-containing protein n=1 Tax=Mycolicibacterium frederiksbergense TaxID=117567 RepID=A0A6H0RZJ4_9MYCO|nr:DUF2207 domain-containing protein [Mycolicibacterium frederiksbergense]QIV79495.1 DUF2207 domain-containing protein [Mycolicibacterium frederiksbergense]
MGGRFTYFLVIAMAWAGLLLIATPPAHADTPFTLDLALDVRDDGTLRVTQTTTVPDGATATSRMPLQIAVEGNRTQHFSVSDISTENGAQATIDGEDLSLSVPAGTSTVRYSVRGTVADGPDLQQFTWLLAAAWSEPIAELTGVFRSPAAAPDSPICAYGQIGIRRLCSLTQTELNGQVSFQHNNLAAGDVVVFSVLLPAETVPASAEFSATVADGGQSPTAQAGGAGLIAATVATVLAGAAVLAAWWRRRSDRVAAQSITDQPNLLSSSDTGGVFTSPDGVLPGQIGSVAAGTVRASDFGATVLDLAVRNYLWLAEIQRDDSEPDFQISRRADLDEAVTPFERAVVDALLPDGRQSILLSELTGAPAPVDLRRVSAEIGRSVAARDWTRQWGAAQTVGLWLLGIGAVSTLVLYVVGVSPLFGVAVAVMGAGITAAALLIPAHTPRGSRLTAALGGLRLHLSNTDPATMDTAAAPVLFERALPYAHAVGFLQPWLTRWGYAGPQQLQWYQSSPASDPPLVRLPVLAATLDGIAAQSQAANPR